MTAITDDHVEWAVVNRLQKMLEDPDPPHRQFNVTHTYALFTSILCWTLQRMRADDANQPFASLLQKFQGEKVRDAPWHIKVEQSEVVPMTEASRLGVGAFPEFADRSAAQFLIDLRNGVAHGDDRVVKPYHRRTSGGPERSLIGFTFQLEETKGRGKDKKVVWKGAITLLESDMRRIGSALADRFCKALRHSDANRHDGHFGRDASSYVVEKAG